MRKIRHILEAVVAYAVYYALKPLGIDLSSKLMGALARRIGPYLGVTRAAKRNLSRALPQRSAQDINTILLDVWENLGRVLGEAPFMENLTGPEFHRRVKVVNPEYMLDTKQTGKGGVIISGHFANWEIAPKTAYEYDMPLALIYRPANNPHVDRLIRRMRSRSHSQMVAKGKAGARTMLKVLKEGGYVGMLVDQKMNDGIPVPFFGKDAMTASAVAELALKFDAPLIAARVRREQGAYFTVTIYPPIITTGRTPLDIMTEVNALFESWIREKPDQWFWLHNRWPKDS